MLCEVTAKAIRAAVEMVLEGFGRSASLASSTLLSREEFQFLKSYIAPQNNPPAAGDIVSTQVFIDLWDRCERLISSLPVSTALDFT